MSALKVCRGCKSSLPVDSFYRHNKMADGRLNFCADCVKRRIAGHRAENLERIRGYDRERGKLPHRREQLRKLHQLGFADPVRRLAWRATSNAIRDGRLIRPAECSACGDACRPDAHHDDYSQPLQVRWLCRPCHVRHHRLFSLREAA